MFTIHRYILWLTLFASGAKACNAGSTQRRYQGFHTLCGTKYVSFHHVINDVRYESDFFVKIEVHEHATRGEEDTLLVPQQPNSSALFTGREDILERLRNHFAPQNEGDRCRKSFLLYRMGGIRKTQICLKFVEEMAGR